MSKKVLYDYFLRTFKYYSPLQNSRIRLKVIFTQFLQNSKGTEMKKKHSWHLFHFRSETPADICGMITVNFCLSLTGQTIIQITQVYSSRWQTANFFTLLMITITLKRALRIWVGYNNLIFGEPGQNNCSSKFAHNDRKTFAGRKC